MFDEPPDPQPNPCPFCEEELGTNAQCEHCRLAAASEKSDAEHSRLKHLLGCRARVLVDMPFGEFDASPSPRHMEAVAMILELAGLPLPAEYVQHARARVCGEYGEHAPFKTTDAELVDRFMRWASQADREQRRRGTFSAEMLDTVPQTVADQLWVGETKDGRPCVFSHAEKLQGLRRPGTAKWGSSLRETIDMALERQAKSAHFWLEFYRDYLTAPRGEIKDGTRFSYVVGDEAYTAHVGDFSEHRHRGFGGAHFTVRLTDGRTFFTNDNWGRGTVPPDLRDLLRANALFVPDPKPEAA